MRVCTGAPSAVQAASAFSELTGFFEDVYGTIKFIDRRPNFFCVSACS